MHIPNEMYIYIQQKKNKHLQKPVMFNPVKGNNFCVLEWHTRLDQKIQCASNGAP